MNMTYGVILAGSLTLLGGQAVAAGSHHGRSLDPMFTAGGAITFGGDSIGRFDVENQFGNTVTEDVDAGGTVYGFGGFMMPVGNTGAGTWGATITAGFHLDGVFEGGGDAVTFKRYPVDLGLYLNQQAMVILFGVTRHLSPEADFSDAGGDITDFNDATGFFVGGEYQLADKHSLFIRYTDIDYEVETDVATEFEGNHVSLGYRATF